jgi:hypothetical protein
MAAVLTGALASGTLQKKKKEEEREEKKKTPNFSDDKLEITLILSILLC